jgi:predicted cupin superfamily sugar epimerase
MSIQEIISSLSLQPHPEGGYYKEVYRSATYIEQTSLPNNFTGKRNVSTSIYYLLQQGDFSAFHRIKSDEIWHYYHGDTAIIHMLFANGRYDHKLVGADLNKGAHFQVVIPAGVWFAAEPTGDFILAGCTVAPGFDFSDFELGNMQELRSQYPQHTNLIERLCR